MKLKAFVVFLAVCIVNVHAEDALEDRLKAVDAACTFLDTDLSAEYRIERTEPGVGTTTTVAAMFRRDKSDQFLILIISPEIDKGKGYLKLDENLWLYDPVGRVFTFTNAKDRFQNSNARNSDFQRPNYHKNYTVAGSSKEKLSKYDCTVLELRARNDSVSFPTVKLWISEDGLIRKSEDYSLSGQLMRTTMIPSYQALDGRRLPSYMLIIDHLKYRKIDGKTAYEQTKITITKPSFKRQPDSLFTKEYLERVNTKASAK